MACLKAALTRALQDASRVAQSQVWRRTGLGGASMVKASDGSDRSDGSNGWGWIDWSDGWDGWLTGTQGTEGTKGAMGVSGVRGMKADGHGREGALGRERKGRENCKLAIENFEFVIHSGTERTKRTKGARGVSGMRGTKADWHGLAGERNVG